MGYVELARAETRRGELVLRERHDPHAPSVLELRANGVFVMDSLETSTERALAASALALVDDPQHVLVGGLGLGFTMHEVLADSRVRRCAVVEIEPVLADWMRDGTIPHGPAMLADDRVTLVVADIGEAVAELTPASYDLVLLDVDNGPDQLVHEANARIYTGPFLTAIRRALRPGGVLAVWSAHPAPAFEEELRQAFGNAAARPLDVVLQGRVEQYWLYVARVASTP